MENDARIALIKECEGQSENCLYTSTSLLIWLKTLRIIRVVFIVLPILFGSLATWKLLTTSELETIKFTTSILAFLAGLMPAIYSSLKFDEELEICKQLAGELKNLQDRFRQAAKVWSIKSFAEFEEHVNSLMDRLESTRKISYTPPEWCFKRAQEKIKKGHYDFDVDNN